MWFLYPRPDRLGGGADERSQRRSGELRYHPPRSDLIFRKTVKSPEHNGTWISTKREHHASLKAAIPAITDFAFDHATETDWLLLSSDHEDFESAASQLCELVSAKDPRIGKITPKSTALFQR